MDKDFVLECYGKIGINSQTGLYDYVINHENTCVNSVNYNLNNSNETMEFMALFLEALGFEVKRMYLENGDKRHWFVVFYNGFKWFYYEPCLGSSNGMHSFSSFNNLIAFAVSKIIKSLENFQNDSSPSSSILSLYTLYSILPLNGFILEDNINQSKNGEEILFWDGSNDNDDFNDMKRKSEKDEIKRRKDGPSMFFWIIGFVVTLIVGVILIWILSNYYYGDL